MVRTPRTPERAERPFVCSVTTPAWQRFTSVQQEWAGTADEEVAAFVDYPAEFPGAVMTKGAHTVEVLSVTPDGFDVIGGGSFEF